MRLQKRNKKQQRTSTNTPGGDEKREKEGKSTPSARTFGGLFAKKSSNLSIGKKSIVIIESMQITSYVATGHPKELSKPKVYMVKI